VWVVDAGATRYFGHAFVVDTLGLNTPDMLGIGPRPQGYLETHPPRLMDVFPGWSRIELATQRELAYEAFEAQTPYTVTSMRSMQVHYLVTCPPGVSGRLFLPSRSFTFHCAP
jgi:hypothetical protein